MLNVVIKTKNFFTNIPQKMYIVSCMEEVMSKFTNLATKDD